MQAIILLLKNFDLPSFLEEVNTDIYSLNISNNNSDVNNTCETFCSSFNDIVEQHGPYRLASRNEVHSYHKPWLNKGLLTSISERTAWKKILAESLITCGFVFSTNLPLSKLHWNVPSQLVSLYLLRLLHKRKYLRYLN